MKSNATNWIIKIVFGLILVISLYLIVSGITDNNDSNNPSNEIIETGLMVNPTNIKLEIGEEQQISATITPPDATYKNLTWESGNSNIVTVDNGKVVGISPGNTIIKVTTEKANIVRIINVTVTNKVVEVSEIKPLESNIELFIGDTKKLEYTVLPEDATNKKLSFKTDNKNVVAFNSEGNLVGVGVGTATITLISNNNITASIQVTVKAKEIEVSSIKLNKTTISLDEGKEATLKATISPSNATNKNITWKSSDEKIVTVDNGKIKAIKKGTATITATANNGKIATCKVTVNEAIKINKIHFIKQSIKGSYAGDAILLESDGHYAMVDTGLQNEADNKFVYNYLKSVGVKELDFILITHNHNDHAGGVVYLLNSDIKVNKFYIKTYIGKDSESSSNTKRYNNIISTLNKKKIPIVYIDKSFTDGQGFTFGVMDIKLYNTEQRMNQKRFVGSNENNNSVMELITVNNKKIFLTGDSYDGEIMDGISKAIGKVDVMKIPHHGYASCSMNSERASRLRPSYLIVTNNKIGDCTKHFDGSIPTYFVRTSKKNAVVVDIGDKITINS